MIRISVMLRTGILMADLDIMTDMEMTDTGMIDTEMTDTEMTDTEMTDTGMTSYTEIDMVTGTEKTEMIDTGMTETDMMDTMGEDEDMGETDVEEKSVPGKPKLSVICPNLEEDMAEADTNGSGGSERMMLTIHEINTEICKNILEHVCEIMVRRFLP